MRNAIKLAEQAAIENGCEVWIAQFPDNTPGTDINDLYQYVGPDEVKRQYAENPYRPEPAFAKENEITEVANNIRNFQPQHPSVTAFITTRPMLYGDHILKGYVTQLTAAGGVGKSMLFITMACCLATGIDLLGLGEVKQRRVLVLNNEDPADEIERRLKAIPVAYRLSDAEQNLIAENIWFQSGYHERLQLAFVEEEGRAVVPTLLQSELISFCQKNAIEVVFIDPLVSIHDANENDNNAMNAVVQILRMVAEEGGVGIYVAHHARKGSSADTPDDNARGASAITAGMRANYGLSRMTKKESSQFVLAEDEWAHLIRLDSGKRNYSPNAANADWFELKNIPIDATEWETGEDAIEWVGVPVPVKLQEVEKDNEGWTLERVMKAVIRTVPASPFTRKGTAGENLRRTLSDTKKPIGHSTLATRMSCFPEPHELPVQVAINGSVYKCWTEQKSTNNNQLFYHYEEI